MNCRPVESDLYATSKERRLIRSSPMLEGLSNSLSVDLDAKGMLSADGGSRGTHNR